MPEYEIKEFEKGRLQRIYNRRPSPKLVVGVDFVDYLEESEDLLKRQGMIVIPERKWIRNLWTQIFQRDIKRY